MLLALRMLYGAPKRAAAMVFGMSFAAFLMAQQSAIFWGVMTWTYAPMRVVQSQIWVAAPQVEQINDYDPLRLVDVQRVKSVTGVAWAVPAYSSYTYARMPDGRHQPVQLMGVEDVTLAGSPWQEIAGGADSLRLPDAVWMDDYGLDFLKPKGGPRLKLGDSFEINERRAVITGVFPARRAFSGAPFVVTTFERAMNYSLPQRRLVSFVLARANADEDANAVAKRIEQQTGLRAFTDEAFVNSTLSWWLRNTGVPGSFLTTVAFSLLFGLTVNAFIFSNYVSQHWTIYASMRAMGASGWQLIKMLLAQSLSMCLLCFCVGTLGAILFGIAVKSGGLPPFLLTSEIIFGVFLAQIIVGLLGPAMSVLKLHRIQPEAAFRNP
jgi:putative ABC transport system permease protein